MATIPDLENNASSVEIMENTQHTFTDFEKGLGKTHKSRFLIYLMLSIAFLAVAIVLLILCLGYKADYNAEMKTHNEYMELINYAKEHPTCNLKGVVTGVDINEETGYYAFGYRITSESLAGGQLDAFSPYIYTKEEISEHFSNGTELQIAVEAGKLNQMTKSVNMSYEDYNLDNYSPFFKAKVGYITLLVAMTVCFVIVFCFFGFSMQSLYRANNSKDNEDDDTEMEVVKANGNRVKVK